MKKLRYLQLGQSFQEAILTKWEAGEATSHSKESNARSKRLQTIESEYSTRDTIAYLKGVHSVAKWRLWGNRYSR